MVWRIVLLALLSIPALATSNSECSLTEANIGGCDVTAQTTTDGVTLDGSLTTPGSTEDTPHWTGPDASAPSANCRYLVADRCLANPDHGVDATPQPITLADIAAFRPEPGLDNMQPNGWAIIGLDTNFFAESPVQVVDGTLLGQPASVRFTPVGFAWVYGDGASRETSTAGAAWAREFDPTPTSHVYEQAGTFVVDLTVSYSAEYRFAGLPWLPVAGTLALPTPPLTVTVGDAKTLLVARDCGQNPTGPGC